MIGYGDKYEEHILSDYEQNLEEERQKEKEELENLKKAINKINEILENSKDLNKEELIGDLEWIVQDL